MKSISLKSQILGAILASALAISTPLPAGAQSPGGKAPVAGIMCLLEPDSVAHPDKHLAQKKCWNNTDLDGVMLRTHWNKVAPSERQFDWSYFDHGVALAKQHHKRLGLSVAAGVFSPEWIYSGGATRFEFREPFNGKERTAVMPLPWDKTFLDQWGGCIRAMGKRYDGSPQVAYVTVGGPGRWVETYFVKAAEDVAKIKELGGLNKWLEGSKRILDLYAEAFPTTPFLIAMAPPTPGPEGDAAIKALVEYGVAKYPGHFGLRSDGLNANTGKAAKPGYTPRTIRALSDKTTVGFQMLLPSAKIKGSLHEALDNAIRLRAHFVEVYAKDCDDPAHAEDLRAARGQLKGNP